MGSNTVDNSENLPTITWPLFQQLMFHSVSVNHFKESCKNNHSAWLESSPRMHKLIWHSDWMVLYIWDGYKLATTSTSILEKTQQNSLVIIIWLYLNDSEEGNQHKSAFILMDDKTWTWPPFKVLLPSVKPYTHNHLLPPSSSVSPSCSSGVHPLGTGRNGSPGWLSGLQFACSWLNSWICCMQVRNSSRDVERSGR